jgi:HlyD family secretion protein
MLLVRASGKNRRRAGIVVNLVIVAALGLVVLMTVRAVRSEADTATAARQTATVDTGAVSATVSASGNVEPSSTAEVSFEGEGGTVTAIDVEVGDKVTKGQRLAAVDASSAQQSLAAARAQLEAAQAGYDTTAEGRTAAEAAQDSASVASAEQQVSSAELSLRNARQSYQLSKQQQDAAVARAERAVAAATTADEKAAARQTLVQARETRESVLLQARQQVAQQEQALRAARIQLSSTRAQVAVNNQGATDGELASARAQVESAQVTVGQAEEAAEETVLRAPMAGTVAAVNGTVGESSSSAASSSSSSDSSTSSTGFITLTSTRSLEVTAYVAEADIADVEVGQPATITLSATSDEVSGEVTHVDTVQTVTNNVVEYGVTVRLDKVKGVRLGATAQVVVTTGEKDGVTRVSTSALTTIGDRTTATVRHDDGTTETVAVTTGLEGDSVTEVLDGLEPGDVVVLPAQEDADNGGFTFPAGGPGGGPGGGLSGGVGGP